MFKSWKKHKIEKKEQEQKEKKEQKEKEQKEQLDALIEEYQKKYGEPLFNELGIRISTDSTNYEQMEKAGLLFADFMQDYGRFPNCGIRIPVTNTENECVLTLKKTKNNEICLEVSVYRLGTDRMYSIWLPPLASTEETIRYLRDPASYPIWLKQIKELSDSVDNYWD